MKKKNKDNSNKKTMQIKKILNTKKGTMTWEVVAKLIIALIILLAIIMLVWFLKDKSYLIFDKIKGVLRFGI